MRLLVTGDRAYSNRRFLRAILTGLLLSVPDEEEFVLIEGQCPTGADAMAAEWTLDNAPRVTHMPFPAKWDTLGHAAGPERNGRMLKQGKPTLVVAFHDDLEHSKGTKHMVDLARKTHDLPVYVIARPPSLSDQRAFFGPAGTETLL